MAETTELALCDESFAPWREVNGTRVKTSSAYWRKPLAWNRKANLVQKTYYANMRSGCLSPDTPPLHHPRVFCASLADVFEDWHEPILDHRGQRLWWEQGVMVAHDGWHPDWRPVTMADLRRDLFALIDQTPTLDWLIPTKHPENVLRMWPMRVVPHPGGEAHTYSGRRDRPNAWLGTPVSDQPTADKAIPELLKLRDLAPVLFVLAEPLLGPVNLNNITAPLPCLPGEVPTGFVMGSVLGERSGEGRFSPCGANGRGIDWVIIGANTRPCNLEWIRDIVGQCRDSSVAVYVKQLGRSPYTDTGYPDTVDGTSGMDKHFWGFDDPKGGDMDEWPDDLKVRDFPEAVIS